MTREQLVERIRSGSRLNPTTAERRAHTLERWREYVLAPELPLPRTDQKHQRTITETMTPDTATPLDAAAEIPVVMKTDGPCLTGTLEFLPLAEDARDALRGQTIGFMENILRTYARDVAAGEVGATGSTVTTDSPPVSGSCPTGLLYGRIQSGKTAAMIVTSALAVDNGFRVIVVVTSDSLELVEQTRNRFEVIDGPLVYSSRQNGAGEYDWNANIETIRREMPRRGLVLIVAKNVNHQTALAEFLRDVGANRHPSLILDDEADQATPDTTTRARSSGRTNAPRFGSAIFRRIVHNDRPDEIGDSLREILHHNVFLQVTATPYALLLQNLDSALRAKGFTSLLEPGQGYAGGETFFASIEDPSEPPLVFVDESEAQRIQLTPHEVPGGLRSAVHSFLVAGALYFRSHGVPKDGFKFLCHTSQRTIDHDTLWNLIARCVNDVIANIDAGRLTELQAAHDELARTVPNITPLSDLLEFIHRRAPNRTMLKVNSAGDVLRYGRFYNFVVGGNILGRGLTIDDLLTTYYFRRAQRTQMDTALQHARMYGYRSKILPLMRVFIPRTLAARFRQFQEAEEQLRALLGSHPGSTRVPIKLAAGTAATRVGVLDRNEILAYRPGQQVYPVEPAWHSNAVGNSSRHIERLLERAFGGPVRYDEFLEVPIESIIELLHEFRVLDDEDSEWDPDAIGAVLRATKAMYGERALIFCREFTSRREEPVFPTGTIGGPEQNEARARRLPTLFALKLDAGAAARWGAVQFWHPTVVFPPNMGVHVFNASE
ncbi:Z1 domain-containing protein [Anaeromyxobacter oryzisoli]|uniref:Z1 domain-containing protein n=1 Tax=Anaeromyxobacter oryzisoli TaxID=2925408 RepID=UPI001F56B51F|nr:Z1 domain-containing protein [Anaeromyxobacter sp. SG63]